MPIKQTPYGPVDAEVLEQLEDSFNTMFNGSPPGGRIEHNTILELAEELSMTLSGYIESLEPIVEMLDQLGDLAPAPDEELEDANEEEEADDDDP